MKWKLPLVCLFWMMSSLQAAPLARRMVDMTYTFDKTTLHHPTQMKYQTKLVRNGTEDDGYWIQLEEYTSAIHVGTHMDAPAHFSKGGKTVDEIPLTQLVAPAAVVDTSVRVRLNKEDMTKVDDLLRWESATGQSLNGTILLLRTGWGKKWRDEAAYFGVEDGDDGIHKWPSIDPVAAQWLVDNRAIHGLGVEPMSFDVGHMSDYPSHRILLGHGLFAIENVANMDQLPVYGAELHVLPMKIGKGSGAPVRIVATFPEVMYDFHSQASSSADCETT